MSHGQAGAIQRRLPGRGRCAGRGEQNSRLLVGAGGSLDPLGALNSRCLCGPALGCVRCGGVWFSLCIRLVCLLGAVSASIVAGARVSACLWSAWHRHPGVCLVWWCVFLPGRLSRVPSLGLLVLLLVAAACAVCVRVLCVWDSVIAHMQGHVYARSVAGQGSECVLSVVWLLCCT